MTSFSPAWSDEALITTVQRLSASVEEQTAYLKRLGTFPSADELALEFHEEFQRVSSDEGESIAALRELDNRLGQMSGQANAALWTADALTREEWEEVRRLARSALSEIEADQGS